MAETWDALPGGWGWVSSNWAIYVNRASAEVTLWLKGVQICTCENIRLAQSLVDNLDAALAVDGVTLD